jgi:hypothetical protein
MYMSKEQRDGHPPDFRHDLFSLGVMWYQLLLGDVTRELRHNWKKELSTRWPNSADQIDLIERCLDCCVDLTEGSLKDGHHLLDLMRKPTPLPPLIRIESLHPQALTVTEGSSATVMVRVIRQNFDGPLTVGVEGLPMTLTVQAPPIQAGGTESRVRVTAAHNVGPVTLNARITVQGNEVQETASLVVCVTSQKPPPDRRPRGLQGRRNYRGPAVWVLPGVGDIDCDVIQMQENQGNARVRLRSDQLPVNRRMGFLQQWRADRERALRDEDTENGGFSMRVSQLQLVLPEAEVGIEDP